MNDIKIIDLHTHTDSSQDGNHPVDLMAQTAFENGIQTVAFTDHCEVDVFYSSGFDKRAERSYKEVSRAKKDFEGKKLRDGGILADIAPTLIDVLNEEKPSEMTGSSLIIK